MDDPVVFSTARQLPHPERESCQLLFVPIISIDRPSQDFRDLPVDDILTLGDQTLLHLYAPTRLLAETVVEPDVFGPLVNELYDKINSFSLKIRGACEVCCICPVMVWTRATSALSPTPLSPIQQGQSMISVK